LRRDQADSSHEHQPEYEARQLRRDRYLKDKLPPGIEEFYSPGRNQRERRVE
jgi:hypothetical protein